MRWLLTKLAAKLTGGPRYHPPARWSSDIWTYNLFRAFEWLFGRRWGIRPEAHKMKVLDAEGRTVAEVWQFVTFESFVVHAEAEIRARIATARRGWRGLVDTIRDAAGSLGRARVITPQFAFGAAVPTGDAVPIKFSPYLFAIAYTTSAKSAAITGTSVDLAFTTSGAQPDLAVGITAQGGDVVTGTTFNGDAMSQVGKTSSGEQIYIYNLPNPDIASANITVSLTPSNEIVIYASLYSGCHQTSQPDSSDASNAVTGVAVINLTTTVVATGCWLFGIARTASGSRTFSAGTGTTQRQTSNSCAIGDSNGTVAPGSRSLQFTWTGGNSNADGIVMSLKPPVDTSGAPLYSLID